MQSGDYADTMVESAQNIRESDLRRTEEVRAYPDPQTDGKVRKLFRAYGYRPKGYATAAKECKKLKNVSDVTYAVGSNLMKLYFNDGVYMAA